MRRAKSNTLEIDSVQIFGANAHVQTDVATRAARLVVAGPDAAGGGFVVRGSETERPQRTVGGPSTRRSGGGGTVELAEPVVFRADRLARHVLRTCLLATRIARAVARILAAKPAAAQAEVGRGDRQLLGRQHAAATDVVAHDVERIGMRRSRFTRQLARLFLKAAGRTRIVGRVADAVAAALTLGNICRRRDELGDLLVRVTQPEIMTHLVCQRFGLARFGQHDQAAHR